MTTEAKVRQTFSIRWSRYSGRADESLIRSEGWNNILELSLTKYQSTLLLTFEADGKHSLVQATPNHFFRTTGNIWKQAVDLRLRESVWTVTGEARLVSKETSASKETVYNLEVNGYHTYFVGDFGVWVHNDCTGGGHSCAAGKEFGRGGPPREPGAGNYVPDPKASGPHTTLGARAGKDGKQYTQGATFDEEGFCWKN
ncbi:MAG: hypothetical protein DWQ01_09155 [Planctomycetota bacterium]|nr:MAG: hypothetical protein DWQ01_09155 [Planctomycetota bacterium]